MSSNYCNRIYTCKNAEWCSRDFRPKTYGCYEVKTHFDEIKDMTVGELSKWLAEVLGWHASFIYQELGECPFQKCPLFGECSDDPVFSKDIERWMRSPVEENET